METAVPGGPGGPVAVVTTQQLWPSPGPMWADLVSARLWQGCFRLSLPGGWRMRQLLERTISGMPGVQMAARPMWASCLQVWMIGLAVSWPSIRVWWVMRPTRRGGRGRLLVEKAMLGEPEGPVAVEPTLQMWSSPGPMWARVASVSVRW